MIPKKIHYCWYGGKNLPELAVHCIESWKKFCPEYEIIQWDETNTNLNENVYIQEAYNAKKWAFVTDYVRLKVLYQYGGIYMDTDVELIAPLDQYLKIDAFSGFENETQIPTGIMGSSAFHPFFYELLQYYKGKHFIKEDGTFDDTTNVLTITNIALKNGFKPNNTLQTVCGMTFYPRDYFCPKDHTTGKINLTDNSVCIHHFNGSWHTPEENQLIHVEQKLVSMFGSQLGELFFKAYKYGTNPSRIVKRIQRKG